MEMAKYLKIGFSLFGILLFVNGCQPSEKKASQPPAEPAAAGERIAAEQPLPSQALKPIKPADIPADAPKIQIDQPSVDLGQVGPSSSSDAKYTFTNVGEQVLKIDHVQSTCGCTVPQLDKKEYKKGESGVVTVTFQVPAIKGSIIKHLYIISNDPANPRAELEIKAEVAVKVEVAPESVELRFDKPNAGMPELTVKSLDDKEFSIKSIVVPNNVMKTSFDPNQKATSFVLKPEVDTKALDTYTTGALQITTNHPQSGILLVRYTALPQIEVNRPRIILQNVEPGQPIMKDVLLRSNYDKPLEIASSESRNGYMEIASDEKDGNHRKLMIKITPPAQDSTARRYITDELTITLKSGEKITIRCSGWFKL